LNYTPAQQKKIEKNIWKYAGYLITNKRATAAILTIYYLTIPGVEAQHLGWILLASSLASFLFEIPSGYLSDKIGHRNMLIVSKAFLVLSSTFFVFASNIWYLVAAGICLSVGFASSSGTGSAFMHDTLKALGRDHEFSKITGKAAALGFGIPLIFSATAPFLIEYSFKAPFVLSLCLDLLGLYFALSLRRIKHSKEHRQEVKETKFKDVLKEAKGLNYLSLATLSGFLSGALIGYQTYRGPYQEFIGVDVMWLGVFFATGRIMASLMVANSAKIKSYFNSIYSFELFQCCIYSIIFILLVLTDNITAIIILFIILNGIQWGLSQVGMHFTVDIIGKSKFKATLLSLRGQVKEGSTAIIALVLGYLVSTYSYHYAFIIFTVFFVITVTVLYLNVVREMKRGKLANEL